MQLSLMLLQKHGRLCHLGGHVEAEAHRHGVQRRGKGLSRLPVHRADYVWSLTAGRLRSHDFLIRTANKQRDLPENRFYDFSATVDGLPYNCGDPAFER